MKWRDHSKLDSFGLRLEGWPSDIPMQNPSSLSVTQNRLLLDSLNNGSVSFVRLDGAPGPAGSSSPRYDINMDLPADEFDSSWAFEDLDEPLNSVS